MKRSAPLVLVLVPFLLAGCMQGSASYMADGADHAISLRAEQDYFWSDAVALKMVVSNLPECQRQFPMTTVDTNGVEVELYGAGEGVYSMRVGAQVMRVDMTTCTRLTEPTPQELGARVGTFRIGADKKLTFDKAPDAPAPPAAEPKGAIAEPAA
jgi:hypothetical protein